MSNLLMWVALLLLLLLLAADCDIEYGACFQGKCVCKPQYTGERRALFPPVADQ